MCLPQTSDHRHGHQATQGHAQQDVELRLIFEADLPALLVQARAADALLLLHGLRNEARMAPKSEKRMENQ